MSTWLLYCFFSISTLIFYIVFFIWLDYQEVLLILDDPMIWGVIFLLVWRHAILGMSIGYHRFYSHRAFKAKRWVEFLIAYSCAASGQGGISWWGANHRYHHVHCDTGKDPHSPVAYSVIYAWFGWTYFPEHAQRKITLPYPETRFLDKWGFLVPWVEWALVWYFSDSRALATLLTILPVWLSTMSTQFFNVRAHGGEANEQGCTATTYKFSSAFFLGEWEHRDHHTYPSKAHRPGPDLPYWLVLFPLAKFGAIWDLQKK